MIDNVKEFCPKLHIQPLSNRRRLVDSKVPLPEVRPNERRTAFVAKMPSSWNAIIDSAAGATYCEARYRARNRKRTERNVITGVALVINDRANDVGPIITFATAAEIIFEVVVELERLATLESQCAGKAPSISQTA